MSFITAQRRTVASAHILYDFLAPSLIPSSRPKRSIRSISSSQRSLAAMTPEASSPPLNKASSSKKPKPKKPLTQAQLDFLNSALRVNQAGELAATLIYTAQTPPLVASHPHLRPLMKHMHQQEEGHFSTFNALLSTHRVRPTAMYPVWTMAASVLGWGTAMMGKEAAMACTEAVETAIGGHYNDQVRELVRMVERMEEDGEVGGEIRGLVSTIRRIRDEELEHLDHAVGEDAKLAKRYELLTGVIRSGCRGAIWVSERV